MVAKVTFLGHRGRRPGPRGISPAVRRETSLPLVPCDGCPEGAPVAPWVCERRVSPEEDAAIQEKGGEHLDSKRLECGKDRP